MTGWALLYGKLLTLIPTFGVTTFDGPALTDDSLEEFAVVGGTDEGAAGGYAQDYSDSTGFVEETGRVLVRFVAQSGETDLSPLRATVQGWVADLSDALRADMTLGGLFRQGAVVRVEDVAVSQPQTQSGAVVEAVVTVGYFTRL